jgi:hypothetical protein
MFADWNIYYKPLHLNNTTGTGSAGGDISSAIDTPFVVLSEADGNSYTPKTTNYMDVYSGGSPFTFTQELVQRGAEVQEDTIRIAIIGNTNEECVQQLQLLRTALTNQHLFGPQILSIKRASQETYTEWLIHGAVIQEENTYLGRDINNAGYPMLFVTITLTRSPYGSDDFSFYSSLVSYTTNGSFGEDTEFNVLDNPELYGAYANFYITINYNNDLMSPPNTFGPVVLATVIEDTKIIDNTVVSGTLTAAQLATVDTVNYAIQNTTNGAYPIQMFVIADVQDNDIEMRLLMNGYATPFVRAVGTQLNSTNGVQRLFVLPSININSIFSGAKDYSIFYNVNIAIQMRNINVSSSRTYSIKRVTMCRTDNICQIFPTTNWSAKSISLANINVYSFYDQIEYPAQSLPSIKAHLTQYNSYLDPLGSLRYYLNNYISEVLDIRGVNFRLKNQYGNVQFILYALEYNGTVPIGLTGISSVRINYSPAYLSIKQRINQFP